MLLWQSRGPTCWASEAEAAVAEMTMTQSPWPSDCTSEQLQGARQGRCSGYGGRCTEVRTRPHSPVPHSTGQSRLCGPPDLPEGLREVRPSQVARVQCLRGCSTLLRHMGEARTERHQIGRGDAEGAGGTRGRGRRPWRGGRARRAGGMQGVGGRGRGGRRGGRGWIEGW